ncbi:MAG: beta-ketoacyl-[acyl-carrier-protein] synthase II [Ignavibacteria bacterium RIFOXYC2_FULL_35_16]|nr:MAG: beta-ketoacyl-[acyl-carrier-protein] synthase II [Ignavibacteria bacterium GWF2_35_20]OGU80659.1 MAG: beta-ketoacyl-[acyl-carrier-protein] synthase II [Ignavibacteria bacterium RIFOXYA2_FULL_35_9]OGU85227.1 MAG: beta-ketoacyl-[acyl-carrier-protein] synthase II [Ignavibacteria bacterium RIFOXYA12_FULL_35_25]OGU91763.1 MAG: beta-ketoacyl-[acyl-carrier-protein] synthase II [Ignavibacteria bacterium RIFOXYC12_FULL_35_11]OGU97420.1 MAG: beta-ketoacyl-[acyl-carrier-protein] synthase II [Ignav
MERRRAVVTGLGVLTSIGIGVDDFWNGLQQGRNGVGLITRFDTTNFDTKFAAEIKNFNSDNYMDRKAAKRMDLFTQYAMATSEMAMNDSRLNLDKIDKEKFGVIFGSGIGGMTTLEQQHWIYFESKTPRKLSPFFVTMMISDIAAGQISIRFGLKGPNYATTSACATSSHAIADAYMLIQRGSADIMICGGSEASITEMAIGGFNAMRALSTWNDRYLEACRPFDKDRSGFVMGEGAGTIVLEEYQHAINRGAKIYAEVGGIGLTADAFHITVPAPNGEGAYRSMKEAMRDAGVIPEDVDHINAHGTSTPYNDVNETNAIKSAFGEHAYKLVINSTKSMTGHLLGAAGGVEAIATILSLVNNKVPPTINLTNPDPECDLNYSANKLTEKKINCAISNTFGFGGHNASLLFKKIEE